MPPAPVVPPAPPAIPPAPAALPPVAPPPSFDAVTPPQPAPTATTTNRTNKLDRMQISRCIHGHRSGIGPASFSSSPKSAGARHQEGSCADLHTNDYLPAAAARAA